MLACGSAAKRKTKAKSPNSQKSAGMPPSVLEKTNSSHWHSDNSYRTVCGAVLCANRKGTVCTLVGRTDQAGGDSWAPSAEFLAHLVSIDILAARVLISADNAD